MGFMIENGILTKYMEEPGVTEAVVPEGVICIGESAFYGCRRLTSVKLPDSLREIRDFAFGGCSALQSVTLPETITSIRAGTFRDCHSLRIVLPPRVKEIWWWAFVQCHTVVLPEGVTYIGDYAFDDCMHVRCRGVALENEEVLRKRGHMTELVKLVALRDFDWYAAERHGRQFSPATYSLLWKMLVADPEDAEVAEFLNFYVYDAFCYLADEADTVLLEAALASELFNLKKYIDDLLEYAHMLGEYELWLMLMNYKNEKIGYDTSRRLKL